MVVQDVRVSGILALVAAVLVWRPLRIPELKALMSKALNYICRRLQKEFRGLPRTESARTESARTLRAAGKFCSSNPPWFHWTGMCPCSLFCLYFLEGDIGRLAFGKSLGNLDRDHIISVGNPLLQGLGGHPFPCLRLQRQDGCLWALPRCGICLHVHLGLPRLLNCRNSWCPVSTS